MNSQSATAMENQGKSSNKEAMEARRRKILQRGSDRLAFITGQRPAFQSQPDPETSSSPQPTLSPKPDSAQNDGMLSSPQTDALITAMADFGSAFLNNSNVSPRSIAQTGSALLSASAVNPRIISEIGSALLSPSNVNRTNSRHSNIFSLEQLSYAIDVSQAARICCVIAIACYIFLCGSLGNQNPICGLLQRVVPSWPFLLVIINDITLVMATMLIASRKENGRTSSNAGKSVAHSASSSGLLSLGGILGSLIVLKKMVTAFSTDFCIYSVVLVCGLSLGQYFVGA